MLTGSCFVQLAAMVVTFSGQKSMVNITSPRISDVISSLLIQFKTSQSNAQIVQMMSQEQFFAINIWSGGLKLEYNFNETGNGSIHLGLVSTNKWFVLNISSQHDSTQIHLSENDNSLSTPCESKFSDTRNITLLGQGFKKVLKTSGLRIGGSVNDKRLTPFKGCIGTFSLNNNHVDLFNTSKGVVGFERDILGTSSGCPCGKSPCGTKGAYAWEKTEGKCVCKCSIGYDDGALCQNRTMSEVSDDDEDDSELLYIAVGIAVGVLLLVACVICVVLYIKRTNSSVFGVYNPKSQEQIQGQPMNTAFTLPVPEKLI